MQLLLDEARKNALARQTLLTNFFAIKITICFSLICFCIIQMNIMIEKKLTSQSAQGTSPQGQCAQDESAQQTSLLFILKGNETQNHNSSKPCLVTFGCGLEIIPSTVIMVKEMRQRTLSEYYKVTKVVKSSSSLSLRALSPSKRFGANRIPFYFRVMSPNNQWRGVDYSIFEIILKFLTVTECQKKFARVCKQWKHLDFKMFCSYSSFKAIENTRFNAKEFKVVLKKGSKTLPHMRVCKEIIRRDFRNQYDYFNKNIALQTKVADTLLVQIKAAQQNDGAMLNGGAGCADATMARVAKQSENENRHRLFQTFKIKAVGLGTTHNLFSDKSLSKICNRSRHSLEDLAIKNATILTNQCIYDNISILHKLQRLDFSYTKQIDDIVVKQIALHVKGLKKLSLRFLSEITAESVSLALENLKQLEGIDLSGCFKVSLDMLMGKFKDNKNLKCLLLEYLFIQPYHIYHLKNSNLETLSLFYSRTVSNSHTETLKQLLTLQNLNIKDCPNLTEEGLIEMIENKEGIKFKTLQISQRLMTERVMSALA